MLRDKKGYTFIEITVVVLLIGLMMALTLPRFRYAVLTDNLKTATRRLVGTIKTIRNEAVREQQDEILDHTERWDDFLQNEERIYCDQGGDNWGTR